MTAINDDYLFPLGAPPRQVSFGWIGEAFALYRANLGLWLSAAVLASFAPVLFTMLVLVMAHVPAKLMNVPGLNHFEGLLLGLGILNLLYASYVSAGVYSMALAQVRGKTPSFTDIFGSPNVVPMLGLLIVFGLLVQIGLALLIVPGVFVAGLLLPSFAQAADGVPLRQALSRSVQAMGRDKASAAGFAFILGLLVLVSLPFGVGLLVTLPMVWLISALAYRDMIGLPENRLDPADLLPDERVFQDKVTYSAGHPRRSLTGEMLDDDGNILRDKPVSEEPVSEPVE